MKTQTTENTPPIETTPPPIPPNEPPIVPLAVILRRHHEITAFASTDASRYVLNGPHYNATAGMLEASDGKAAIRVPVELVPEAELAGTGLATGGGQASDCIVPSAILAKAAKNIPNGNTLEMLQTLRLDTTTGAGQIAPAAVTLTATDTDQIVQAVKSRAIDGTFPKLDQVWPKGEVHLEMAFDPELLGRICAYAKKHALEKKQALTLRVYKDSLGNDGTLWGALEFELHVNENCPTRVKGVIMPMRVS